MTRLFITYKCLVCGLYYDNGYTASTKRTRVDRCFRHIKHKTLKYMS